VPASEGHGPERTNFQRSRWFSSLLLARMNGQEVQADVLLRPELVQRRSTAPPRPSGLIRSGLSR
jgi:hypothetical protein